MIVLMTIRARHAIWAGTRAHIARLATRENTRELEVQEGDTGPNCISVQD
jgi:hypothetical protein